MATKPLVYLASAYTKGDVAVNVHFQLKTFDELMTDGVVWPVCPLWNHFQHAAFPRAYGEWLAYDQAMLPLYDACLRLTATEPRIGYTMADSSGADKEVETFRAMGKPVFFNKEDLYEWVKQTQTRLPVD